MQKTLFILLVLLQGCSQNNNSDYVDINPSLLEKELNVTKSPKGYLCVWEYSHKEEYHLFKYSCQKDKKPLSSILEIRKMYKVHKDKIGVKYNSGRSLPESMGTPIKYVEILWGSH